MHSLYAVALYHLYICVFQIEYKISENDLRMKMLQVSVWDHDMLGENNLIGAIYIKLRTVDLSGDNEQWYNLDRIQVTDASMLA